MRRILKWGAAREKARLFGCKSSSSTSGIRPGEAIDPGWRFYKIIRFLVAGAACAILILVCIGIANSHLNRFLILRRERNGDVRAGQSIRKRLVRQTATLSV